MRVAFHFWPDISGVSKKKIKWNGVVFHRFNKWSDLNEKCVHFIAL